MGKPGILLKVAALFFLLSINAYAAITFNVTTPSAGSFQFSWSGVTGYVVLYEKNAAGIWIGINGFSGSTGSYNVVGKLSGNYEYKLEHYCAQQSSQPAYCETVYRTVVVAGARPTISAISNITINEDSASPLLNFTVSDADTPLSALTISRASSNTALIPVENIVVGGAGGSRSVRVTPAANKFGAATCSGQVFPDNDLSFSSFTTGGRPSLAACGLRWL